MNHGNKKGRRFGRTKKQRHAMLYSLAVSLINHENLITTEEKAKELSKTIEPLITKARRNSIYTRRQLTTVLTPSAVKKLIEEIAPRYATRPGGYTRITHVRRRKTDGAKMAKIQLV